MNIKFHFSLLIELILVMAIKSYIWNFFQVTCNHLNYLSKLIFVFRPRNEIL